MRHLLFSTLISILPILLFGCGIDKTPVNSSSSQASSTGQTESSDFSGEWLVISKYGYKDIFNSHVYRPLHLSFSNANRLTLKSACADAEFEWSKSSENQFTYDQIAYHENCDLTDDMKYAIDTILMANEMELINDNIIIANNDFNILHKGIKLEKIQQTCSDPINVSGNNYSSYIQITTQSNTFLDKVISPIKLKRTEMVLVSWPQCVDDSPATATLRVNENTLSQLRCTEGLASLEYVNMSGEAQ